MIFKRFFQCRQEELNSIYGKQIELNITEEWVHSRLEELEIYFVDFPEAKKIEQTDTTDPDKKFPIFINTLR